MSIKLYFVTPGVAPTLHALARFNEFIKLLLPTFGKPEIISFYGTMKQDDISRAVTFITVSLVVNR